MSSDDGKTEKKATGQEGTVEDLPENDAAEKDAEGVKGGRPNPGNLNFVHYVDKSSPIL